MASPEEQLDEAEFWNLVHRYYPWCSRLDQLSDDDLDTIRRIRIIEKGGREAEQADHGSKPRRRDDIGIAIGNAHTRLKNELKRKPTPTEILARLKQSGIVKSFDKEITFVDHPNIRMSKAAFKKRCQRINQ